MDTDGNLKNKVGDKMALIKCPECGGQVSDKAQACIHCGYPLQEIVSKSSKNIWNNTDVTELEKFFVGLSKQNKKSFIYVCEYFEDSSKPEADPTKRNLEYPGQQEKYKESNKFVKDFSKKNNMNRHDAGKFILEYLRNKNYAPQPHPQPSNQVRCPKCGSTAITTEERGYSLWIGWYGANEKKNLCQSCGYKWKPGS